MPQDHHKSSRKESTARRRTNESKSQAHSAAEALKAIVAIAKVLARQAAQEDDAAEALYRHEVEGADWAARSNSPEFS